MPEDKKDEFPPDIKEARKELKDEIVETEHSISIGGKKIDYVARTGTLVLKYEEDKKLPQPKGVIFFVAYHKKGVKNREDRPVTFSYNGGPGSSSVWLHMGMLGPKVVVAERDEKPVPPPYTLEENEFSILDLTDLVFIDPVGTGYSRAAPGEKAEQFHTFEKDVESVGDFIRLYTSKFNLWASPKLLVGESYGTTRSAGLSGYLQDRHGIFLSGIMLISSILNFQTAKFDTGNDLPYVLFLPTYAATAHYHGKLPDKEKKLETLLQEVREFALGEYTLALMQGDNLSEDEYSRIAEKLHQFTGLSLDYIKRTNLRIQIHRFTKELLRDQGITVGRLDTRYTGFDRDAVGEYYEFDPSYAAIQGPYTATFNHYIREELKHENDLTYEILANLYTKWKYDKQMNQYLDVGETLRNAMSKNPFLKVFVANGYYDLATPFFATEYTFSHMFLNPTIKSNVSMEYYDAGHMMYLKRSVLQRLKQDILNFFKNLQLS